MNTGIHTYAALAVIIFFALYAGLVAIGAGSDYAEENTVYLKRIYTLMLAGTLVLLVCYPVAIIRTRLKFGSFLFLKSPLQILAILIFSFIFIGILLL